MVLVMSMKSLGMLLLSLLASVSGHAANLSGLPPPAERWLKEPWTAHWITHPAAPKNEYGIYLFRKSFELASRPAHFVVHVSGDTRYRLYVNGKSVSFGPQRSDAWVWHYDSVDLAPWLQAGANVIAARVVAYGEFTPYANVGVRTGLLVKGDSPAEQVVDTGATWKVAQDEAYSPVPVDLKTYVVVGPGVHFEGEKHPWGWKSPEFDDRAWTESRVLGAGSPYGWGTDMDHSLVPRTIPLMEESPVRFSKVRRFDGAEPPPAFVEGKEAFDVPAHSHATVLLDQGVETNAFPRLTLSGGAGSRVRLTYAEALVDEAGNKGARDVVEGRHIEGIADEFVSAGGDRREYGPLDFRTYRYVEMEITTGDTGLRIDDFHGQFTGYPFERKAKFTSSDPSLSQIFDVGWRTARLCAFETYMDCPYYEQLQYVGDTRIQSLISLYAAGDDRLMRNAIELYDRSRLAEGLTQSRYPSAVPQVINTFSLFWVDMVHDYWMHRTDDAFIEARLPGIQAVLAWFERKIDPATGLLGPLQYWTFVDWTNEWAWDNRRGVGGEPDGARSGGSSIVSLQYATTLRQTAELCRAFGRTELAAHYEKVAASLRSAAKKLCWDPKRKLFADTPGGSVFSQHANTAAVLAGVIEGRDAADLMRRVVADQSLIQSSTYHRFYLLRAMKRASLGDDYVAQLGPWRTMLDLGLTTFAEQPEPTRSDCHAWSASPVYELLATVCGIEPDSPGFRTVRIEPHLGGLQRAAGTVPHPQGEIEVSLERQAQGLVASIALPAGVSGRFLCKGKTTLLKPGAQTLTLR
jgi:hypothetical protein